MKKKDQTMSAITGRMHVVIEIMLIAFLLGGVVYVPEGRAAEQDAIQVYLEDQQLSFTVPPQTLNGRVMVPMRPIFEAMNAVLTWEQATSTATAIKGNTTVITQIGNSNATINGMVQTLDVPPTAINGSTLAPLRFVAEAFGYHVKWDGASQAAYIAVMPFPQQTVAFTSDMFQWNGVRCGMSQEEVRAILGEPRISHNPESGALVWNYANAMLYFGRGESSDPVYVILYQGTFGGQISTGDDYDALESTFGAPTSWEEELGKLGDGPNRALYETAFGTVEFYRDNGKIGYISIE